MFTPDGNMAYMPGVAEMTVSGLNGALMTVHTHGVSRWRRDPHGVWRCVLDIATELPPL